MHLFSTGLTYMLKNKELGTEYFLPLWKDIDWYMGVAVRRIKAKLLE